MKTTILMAVIATLVSGCITSKQPAGAPPSGYDTEMGEGREPLVQSNAAPLYPEGSYFLWKNQGITPTTP